MAIHYLYFRERPIQDLRPMSDVAMAISTDADTDSMWRTSIT